MFITDLLTITELSRLTKKSRPTTYKYINDFNCGNYDDIPFSFIELLKMSHYSSKADIENYCRKTYGDNPSNEDFQTQEVLELIRQNHTKIDMNTLKNFILKEIQK